MVRISRWEDLLKRCLASVNGIQLKTKNDLEDKGPILLKCSQVKDDDGDSLV